MSNYSASVGQTGTSMTVTARASSYRLPPSEAGRERLLSLPHEPLFLAGRRDVVMLNFALDADALKLDKSV
jgi:hypothetical protein